MARPFVVVLSLTLLVAAGCGEGGGRGETTVAVPCNDAGFRGQDEELYVTKTVISNAIGSSREPAAGLPDLSAVDVCRRIKANAATASTLVLQTQPAKADKFLSLFSENSAQLLAGMGSIELTSLGHACFGNAS